MPWQQNPTPYRVWVSEIMLQQTQVATVIPYYQRFMSVFGSIEALANAPLDEVLALWSGLGYYARARNLHKTAQLLCKEYGGQFPNELADIECLPGIGRSTAGAIASFSMGQATSILDGNVKRVLSRCYAIDGWPGHSAVQKQLWQLADALTPRTQTNRYNQAIMDLGASCCTAKSPTCEICPMKAICLAKAKDLVSQLPTPKKKSKLPIRTSHWLVLKQNATVWLQQKPAHGLWGGLWVFPSFEQKAELEQWCQQRGVSVSNLKEHPLQRHTFSHYHLDYIAYVVECIDAVSLEENGDWYPSMTRAKIGLPKPVSRLIEQVIKNNVMFCQKLQKEAEELKKAPFPGEIGQRIVDNISKEAWDMWLAQQTMIINENRLTPFESEAKAFLKKEMLKFLFDEA